MINEMAENNELVSPELMEKFSNLQDLLSEIMNTIILLLKKHIIILYGFKTAK